MLLFDQNLWIRLGNCSTSAIAGLLAKRAPSIEEFRQSPAGLLILDARTVTSV